MPWLKGMSISINNLIYYTLGIRIYYWQQSDNLEIYYHLNDLFCLLVILRLYVVCRILLGGTIYCSPSAFRLW